MNAPHVVRVGLHRAPASVGGLAVLVALLQSEGVHAVHEAGPRVLVAPGDQRPADPVSEVDGVPTEEVDLMADEEGEQISRVPHGDVAEERARSGHVAGYPAPGRGEVGALAGQRAGVAVGRAKRGPGAGHGALLGGHQPQIGAEHPSHDAPGVGCDGLRRRIRDRGPKADQMLDRPVVRGHRLARSGQAQTLAVYGHFLTLQAHRRPSGIRVGRRPVKVLKEDPMKPRPGRAYPSEPARELPTIGAMWHNSPRTSTEKG